MALPDLIFIGPMKAGTTWIDDYLRWRGDVCLPDGVKETFYFDRYADRSVEWYASNFRSFDSQRHRRVVEVAPSLYHCPDAPARIAQRIGEVDVVVCRRDPVARSWSHYMHLRRKGYTRLPLREACGVFPEILQASRYDVVSDRWRQAFTASRFHQLEMAELSESPDCFARRICSICDVPFSPVPDTLKAASNAAGIPPSYLAAKLARATSNLLRGFGVHGLVNLGKRLRLDQVVFGSGRTGAERTSASESDLAWLREQLGEA